MFEMIRLAYFQWKKGRCERKVIRLEREAEDWEGNINSLGPKTDDVERHFTYLMYHTILEYLSESRERLTYLSERFNEARLVYCKSAIPKCLKKISSLESSISILDNMQKTLPAEERGGLQKTINSTQSNLDEALARYHMLAEIKEREFRKSKLNS